MVHLVWEQSSGTSVYGRPLTRSILEFNHMTRSGVFVEWQGKNIYQHFHIIQLIRASHVYFTFFVIDLVRVKACGT